MYNNNNLILITMDNIQYMYNNNNLILITMDSITNYEMVRKCLLELLVLPKIIKFTKKL